MTRRIRPTLFVAVTLSLHVTGVAIPRALKGQTTASDGPTRLSLASGARLRVGDEVTVVFDFLLAP